MNNKNNRYDYNLIQNKIKKAHNLEEQGKFTLALNILDEIIVNKITDNIEKIKTQLTKMLIQGRVYFRTNLIDEAEEILIEGFKILKETDAEFDEIRSEWFLFKVSILMVIGNYKDADKTLLKCKRYFQKLNKKEKLANVYNTSGALATRRGEIEKAKMFYKRSLRLLKNNEFYLSFYSRILGNLANIEFLSGNYNEAKKGF